MKKAVLYIRVSTRMQAEEGRSMEAQEASLRLWALNHGFDEVTLFADSGQSGLKLNRPGLKAALDMAVNEQRTFIVYSLSRVARSVTQLIEIATRLQKAKVDLVSITEQLDTTTAMGKAMFNLLAMFAQLERDVISERTADVMRHMKSVGDFCGGATPYGFRRDPNRRNKVIACPEELATIERIRTLGKAGVSARGIARNMNEAGIKTKLGRTWHHTLIKRILVS